MDFGLTIIYHYWLVSCNPPLQDVNNRGNCMCVEAEEWEGGRGIWKLSVFSVQFLCKSKNSLNIFDLLIFLKDRNQTTREMFMLGVKFSKK